MTRFYVSIPGPPIGKARQRHRIINAKAGAFVQNYDPAKGKSATFQRTAVALCREAHKGEPLAGPVAVCILAVAQRPKRLMRKKDPEGRMHRCAKPDVDNVAKNVLDAMTRAGVFKDDKDVAELTVASLYTAKGEEPVTEVWAHEVHDAPPLAYEYINQGAMR